MREIAELARKQYQAWWLLAREWKLNYDHEEGQERCGACDIGIINHVDTRGVNRPYTEDERLSLVVGHLRNHHRDLESTVYKEAGIS